MTTAHDSPMFLKDSFYPSRNAASVSFSVIIPISVITHKLQ